MRTESSSSWRQGLVVGLLVMFGLAISPAIAAAAGRVALVVGNSTYTHIGRLGNPVNDATDVSSALRRLGFEVTAVFDANRAQLTDALREFTRQSAGVDVSLVFYAGHGIEIDGVNYLLPVDARIERDTDVRYETVTLEDVLAATEGAGLRLVILDACRNNPLASSIQRTVATRSISLGGFGELGDGLLGEETLVAYAAAARTRADDGTGRNSPYTTALLEYLQEPLEIGMLFRRVRARVLELTDQRQRPHEYHSLLTGHYLAGSGSGSAQEGLFWQTIEGSSDPEDFRAYLRVFPNGVYARLATNRLEDVSRSVDLSAMLGRELSASLTDDNNWTDLHYAAALDLPDDVRYLLSQGARINAEIRRDGGPLGGSVARLLRDADLDFDTWTRDGETPLHVAASVGAREAVLELLEAGANEGAGTKFDWRPLHYAAWANASDVVEALLTYGADIDARTDEVNLPGKTALQVASEAGSSAAAETLRANGATR